MANSPTAKEVSVDLSTFKSSVDQQFKSLTALFTDKFAYLQTLIYWMFGIMTLIVGGGFLIRSDFSDVKAELAKTTAQVAALREDIGRIEKRAMAPDLTQQIIQQSQQILSLQSQMNSAIRRIEDKLPQQALVASASFSLTDEERALIRGWFGLDKGPSKAAPKYKIGDFFSGGNDLPDELVGKLTRLKGFKIAFDPSNGSALLISAGSRIVAIVEQA